MYVPVTNPRKQSLASIARRADDSQATPGESAASSSSSSSSSTSTISTSTSTNGNESDGAASTTSTSEATSSTSSVVTSQSTSSTDNTNKASATSSVSSDVASSSAVSSTLTATSSSSSSASSNAIPTSSSVSPSSSTASSSGVASSTAATASGNTSALSNGGASESTSASVANTSIQATSTADADNSESSSAGSSSVTASASSASVPAASTPSSAAPVSSENPVPSSSLPSSDSAAVPAPTVSSTSVPTPRDGSSASAVPSPSHLPSSSSPPDVSNVASSSDPSPSSTLTALASASSTSAPASSSDLLSISLDPVGGVGSVLGGVNSVLGGVLGSGSDEASSTVDPASASSASQATDTALSGSADATTSSDVASATSAASASDSGSLSSVTSLSDTLTATDSADLSSATDISGTTDTGLSSTATDSSSSTDSVTQTIFFSSTPDNAVPIETATDTTSDTTFPPQGNGNKGVSSLAEPTSVAVPDPQQRIAPTSVSSSSTLVPGNVGEVVSTSTATATALPDNSNSGSSSSNGSGNVPQAVQGPETTIEPPSAEATIAVGGGSSVTLITSSSLPTGTGSGTNNTGQPGGTASPGNAPASALSSGAIAGIVISIAGSAVLVLLIIIILLRRRRERARARLAHESFGPGVRSASSQSRHAPSPSGVAFLPGFLHGSNRSARSSNDSVRDGPGFFARARNVFTPRRFGMGEKGMGMDQQWEFMNEKPTDVYERGLVAGEGEGSFLPPPVRAVSPIAPFPFMSSGTSTHSSSNSGGNVIVNPFSDPSSERAGTPIERGKASTPVPGSTPVPRADDPFWDPEDLLPPALRLSALQKEAAAKKAATTASSSGAVPATGGDGVATTHGFAGVGAYNATSSNGKRNITSPSDLLGPLPSDPFADPGIVAGTSGPGVPSNASQGATNEQPMKMPDIFDFRASSVSDSGADAEAAREGYTSWVSQPGWASRSSTRSSGVSNDNSNGISQQQPPFSSSTPSLQANLLGSGSDDRSVLASSYGSGVGPDSESSLRTIATAGDSGVTLGMLRSESPRTFGSVSGETSSRMSYVSAESHGSSHYQEFGNAL